MTVTETIKLLDVVALTVDLPRENLRRGQVGTAVEPLGPDVWLIEFADINGETYAELPLKSEKLIVLHYTAVTK